MDRSSSQPIQLLVLTLLAGLLFFIGLGSMGLTDRDEGRNAEAGREMFASGDLVTPTFNGELRVAKPVFVYWLMTLSYHVFGVNEFAARAPSAFFGVGLILMHYLFLSRLRGPTVGLFGALMLLLNIEILALGRMAITDSVLIFFTTLSLYSFWLGLHEDGAGRHWIWGFYAGMALATLTKRTGGICCPADDCASVSSRHSAMAGLLGEGCAHRRHFAIPHSGCSLVCRHACSPWRCIFFAGQGSHSGTIPCSDGRTWRRMVVLFSRLTPGLLPLECAVTRRVLPILYNLARIPRLAVRAEWNSWNNGSGRIRP
ncbi:MAG: glycosyltransferase family 39 protein [Nitrospira sp.]|nr:glycosyltransferase family 39 protein [Nitrospira sp.]